MQIDSNRLWDKSNPVHIISYRKKDFNPESNCQDSQRLVRETGEFFNFDLGYRITGALSVYAQINPSREVSDVDVCIDEEKFLEVTQIGIDRNYSFCRLSQRELKRGIRTCVFEEIPPEEFLRRKPSVRAVLLNRSTPKLYSPLDIIDVFVGFVDGKGWENTYDHRLSPVIPITFPTETRLEYEGKAVRMVSLEYMAVVKAILLEEEDIFGVGNRLDREKNKFDLENILRNLNTNFSGNIKEILHERRKRREG